MIKQTVPLDLALKMAEALKEARGRCFCSIKERVSGHRIECASPRIEEALAAYSDFVESELRKLKGDL